MWGKRAWAEGGRAQACMRGRAGPRPRQGGPAAAAAARCGPGHGLNCTAVAASRTGFTQRRQALALAGRHKLPPLARQLGRGAAGTHPRRLVVRGLDLEVSRQRGALVDRGPRLGVHAAHCGGW